MAALVRLSKARRNTLKAYSPAMRDDAIARLQLLGMFRTAAEEAELAALIKLQRRNAPIGSLSDILSRPDDVKGPD